MPKVTPQSLSESVDGLFGVLLHPPSISQLLLTHGNTSLLLLILTQAQGSFQCPVLLHQKLRHSGKWYKGVQESLGVVTTGPRSISAQPSQHQPPPSTDEATEVQGLPPRIRGGFKDRPLTCFFHPISCPLCPHYSWCPGTRRPFQGQTPLPGPRIKDKAHTQVTCQTSPHPSPLSTCCHFSPWA